MNPNRKQLLLNVVNLIMVLSVVFNLVLPAADLIVQAQEATQEPTPAEIATDVPTDEPTATQPPTDAPTDVPTEVATIAPTDVPTDAATTEVTEVVPSEPTVVPTVEITQPPVISVFQDDFQDANFDGWLLTPGWQLGVEGENLFLTTANPNESAAIANLSLADFSFAARARITNFDHVNFTFRAGTESYVVTLDALGNVGLSRGDVLLAQGTLVAPPADGVIAPVWHTLNVQALGGLLMVSVDGVAQISFTDPAPLPAGGISISTDTLNTGAVSLDQIIVGEPQPIVVVPIETPVPLPTAAPTEEPTLDVPPTEEVTPEVTSEATIEATEEALPTEEVTPESTPTEEQPASGQVVLTADFESDLIGWLAGEGTSVVVEGEGNQALLMTAGATLLPADTLYLADFQVDTRFNIASDAQDGSATGFSFAFRTQDGQGYVLSVEAAQTVLYRSDAAGLVPLATSATAHDLNVWHTLQLNADGGHFVAAIDGVAEVDFTDAEPLTNGQIGFAANAGSSIMLDDIIVTDFTPVDVQVTVTPTALVAGLSDEERAKLTDVLGNVVDAYAQGDETGALDLAAANFLPMDEQGRVSVMVWAAEGLTGQDVAPIVQAVGGEVDFVNDYNVQARVPLGSFIALVNAPQLFWVDITSQAVSTGNAAAPADAPAGNVLSEGYDVIGTNDWHLAGLTGSGSKVAIIDTGFSGVSAAGEWACLSGSNPGGSSTHGNMVLQVVCDVAPNAAVKLYRATDAATLANKIDTAVTDGNQIILITMDLGVDTAPGDGVGIGGSAEDVYTAIDHARNTSNRLVIVSAGNNNGRQVNFNYTAGGTTTISITANAGDFVNVAWDDWGSSATGKDLSLTLSGSGITALNYNVNRPAGGSMAPSKQFTVPNQGTCNPAPAALCALTLTINSAGSQSAYVQVQATGIGAVNTPGGSGFSNVNTTSTIGRPGDSPDALTVGAVCTYKFPYEHFPLLAGSSRGPVFGNGGTAPSTGPFNARNKFKPDLVGPSEVSTSFDANGDGGIDSLGLCDDTDTDGFTGTSAAAAHVAAMAALIRTDAKIAATTPAAIVDYMQSHSVDLFEANGIKPDGFDMSYGSGLAVLGNPNPPEAIATDPATLPNGSASCASGSIRYVSPFNLSVERNLSTGSLGTWTNPYIHPAQAIANAQVGDCVVLLPGEYVGDIYIDNNTSKDGVSLRSFESLVPTGLNSIFWVNNDVQPDAGIAVGSSGSPSNIDFTISGFQFYPGHPLGSRTVGGITYPSHIFNTDFNAILVSYSTGHVVIDNSTFTGFPNSPVTITNSQDVTVQNSRFSGQDLVVGAAVTIQGSGSTTPIVVQYNTFTENTLVKSGPTFYGFPLLWLQNAAANIFNNRIFNNFQGTSRRGTIITVQNSSDSSAVPLFPGALPVQVVGNAIFDNYNIGPVVYLGPGRRFRFVNNTVAHQTSLEAGAKAVIQRSFTGEPATGNGALEINNNIFFNNGHSETDPVETIFDDFGPNTACYDFNGNADSGMKNNWSWNSGGVTADCVNSLAGFNNLIDDPLHNPTNDFIVNFQPGVYDDPYQIIGTSFGIDYGNDSYLGGIITTDVLKHTRINGSHVDVGAYEYKTVGGTDFTVTIPEDTNNVPIAMDQYVSGGFAPYSLEILGFPQNYATDTDNACGGQPLALSYNATTKKNTITYCPPPNFYNNTGTPPESAVSFTYLVHDSFGGVADTSNVATITVTKVPDVALSTPIPTYTILTQADTPISFRLRPYAKFQNFRFSESGNQADYPFTYSAPSVVTTGLPNENLKLLDTNNSSSSQDEINAAVAAVSSSGLITVTPKTGEVGFIEFTYTIKDDPATNGANDTTTGTVIIRVVGSIPDSGLHDDTSFAFDYHGATNSDPGLWIPVYSEPNINNTLHNTSTVNDTAEFLMTGAGFALYMQGNKAGGKWELQLDNGGSSVPFNWTLNPTTGRYNSSAGGVTCTTSGTSATGTLISNLTTAMYVVSCNGLLEDQANTIRIINKENKLLSIDALGIVRDTSPLLNGFHEVTEKQVIPIFYGWTPLTDTKASNQRAMVTTNTNIPDVTFRFKGTGFAIGTVLEKYKTATTGTKYDICVAKAITPALKVCQSFDNSVGAATATTYNVFRPFFGFDPTVEYEVTLNVTSIPTGGRMYVDSIVVFNQQPTAALSIGTTEDDNLGPIVFGGGKEDTWSLNTVFTKASNGSLTSINKGVPFVGPFVSFRIPDQANTINWYRYAGNTDSNKILICVDRAQGDIAGDQSTHCVIKDLKFAGNPVIIKEDEFDYNGPVAGTGWGSPWGLDNSHTVEIFSLTNQPFNVDKIQVLNSGGALTPGYFEENVPGIRYFSESGGTYTLDPIGGSANFTDVVNAKASGGKYKLLNADSAAAGADTLNLNEGMFFQFSGTGFSTYFTMDRKSDAVRICWKNNIYANNPDGTSVADVLNTGACQTFDNESSVAQYQAARTVVGLPFADYSVVVQMLGDQGEPVAHISTYLPITMGIDAIQVYNHNPMPGNILDTLGTRYETSFVNRSADDTFVYLGNTWKSVSGKSAALYSGQNYDSISASVGTGVVFSTDGTAGSADSLIIYRGMTTKSAALQVCVNGATITNRTCTIINTNGGAGYQQPIVVPLGSTGAHIVSVMTMDAGAFALDAFELGKKTTLTAGVYDENDPALVYSNTTDPLKPIRSQWKDIPLKSYSDGGAMQSILDGASLTFSFTGTGFSLISQFDALSGTLDVDINGAGTNDYLNQVFDSYFGSAKYGASHSITGLPLDTYTVTITENHATRNRFTVDGVEIYNTSGTPTMAPGIYDDDAVNSSSAPYISYGPSNGTWTLRTGTSAAANLNKTSHLANRYGAEATFNVTGANLVTLFDVGTTSPHLRICAKKVGSANGSATWFCQTTTTLSTRGNLTISLDNSAADIALNAGGPGDYAISVTMLDHAKNLYIDAIGVYPSGGTLVSGMYQDNHPFFNASFTGSWLSGSTAEGVATDKFVKSTGTGNSGDAFTFQFTGTGFSIVLAESSATSTSYTLCVQTAPTCNVINQPLVPVGATSAKKPVALTYVGFTNTTYTVKITNNDSSKPLLVDRVDILGTVSQQIASSVTGNVENTDSRITYFPYFSFTSAAASAASGGSQHTGTMQGSIIYFELNGFTGTGIDYVRQTLSAYGSVAVCSGAIGTNSSGCAATTVNNNVAPFGYLQTATVPVTTGTKWVAIRNADGKMMPFDFVRPLVSGAALTAGLFQENHPSLSYFTENAGIYTVLPSGNPGNFVDVVNAAASGGSLRLLSADVGSPGNGLNEGVLFQFNGTGFGVKFMLDKFADAVKICWVNSLSTDVATVLGGTCQLFDNQSATTRNQAERVIHGLPSGDHTVVVQMLADNLQPAAHVATSLPLTMNLDAVEVFGDNWTGLNQLTVGTRYETSFVNAAADNNFIYVGNGWKSVSGKTAAQNSGSDYDQITNVIGAGVVFRTTGGNSIILYRDTKAGYAPVIVCAAPTGDQTKRYCTLVQNNVATAKQAGVQVFLNDPNSPGAGLGQIDDTSAHVVSIMTLDYGTFILDAVEVINASSTAALVPGFYEDNYPALAYSNPNLTGSEIAWASVFNKVYTDGRVRQTSDNDAEMIFHITNATGFAIGTVEDKFGGEVEVCYNSNNNTGFPAGAATRCFTYEDERAATSNNVSRTVTGLTTGSTYAVRVRGVEDGTSVLTNAPRLAGYTPSRMRIDYVEVFGTPVPTVVPAGYYNENAVDGSGNPYLQLLPSASWFSFTGSAGKGFSYSSYAGVIDTKNKVSALYAGPVATLRVTIPSGAGADGASTVVLYTGAANKANTDKLLVCANGVHGSEGTPAPDCTIITNLRTTNHILLTESVLSALGADGTTVTLSFRALTPGYFRIDGFQVISGTTLVAGIYDDFLFASGGLIDAGGTGIWTLTPTTGTVSAKGFGGTIALAKSSAAAGDDPTLNFKFSGTGFSIITQADAYGADFRMCYKLTTSSDPFPASNTVLEQEGNLSAGDVLCNTRTTDTTVADWHKRNGGEPLVATAYQYGFDVHGLPNNDYTVEIRLIDTTIVATDALKVDAVAIFGSISGSPLTAGTLYDDSVVNMTLSQGLFWSSVVGKSTPPKGQWDKTETNTSTAGAIAQLSVNGNALVLYQTANAKGSNYALLCITTSVGQDCTQFSQNSAVTRYFTPIVFYGLGNGTHSIVIENRAPGKFLNIDAIRILP